MAILIGFTGYAKSGKDTAARSVSNTEPGAVTRAFATALRAECAEAFPRAARQLWHDESLKELATDALIIARSENKKFVAAMLDLDGRVDIWQARSPRRIMQLYGTEYRRRLFGNDYWVERLTAFLDTRMDSPVHLVTDVRFPNEAAAILNRGGEIWKIIRPGVVQQTDHVSEAFIALIAPNRILFNDGTADELLVKARTHYQATLERVTRIHP